MDPENGEKTNCTEHGVRKIGVHFIKLKNYGSLTYYLLSKTYDR